MGSKSALDKFLDGAKELGSWSTSRLKLNPNRRRLTAPTCAGSELEVTPKPFLVSEPSDCILGKGRESEAQRQVNQEECTRERPSCWKQMPSVLMGNE